MNKKENKISKEIKINKKLARRDYSNQTGITLIALVVTIVVLLILAGVSINAIFSENGIINRAKDAQNKMNLAIENDQKGINELSKWLDNQVNRTTGGDDPVTPTGNWTQNKTSVTNGTTTYTVGDDYTYDCGVSGYTGVWKVLGAENGKLLIMSTVDVGTLQLSGKDGYNTGISQLNTMCAQYGTNARSIKVEDINRVTGYDPTNQGDGTVFGAGQFYEYGNKVTYTASGSSATNGKTYTGSISYEHPDGRKIGTALIVQVANTVKADISSEYVFVRYMGPKFAIVFSGIELNAIVSFMGQLKEKIEKIEKSKLFQNPQTIRYILFILFFIPGTPKDLLTYIAALLPIKPTEFILISTLARFPSVISSTLAGASLLKGNWKLSLIIYGVTFAIVAVVVLIMRKLDKNKITDEAIRTIQ